MNYAESGKFGLIYFKGGIALKSKLIILSSLLLILLTGCFGGSPGMITSLEITPESSSIQIGEKQEFIAISKDENGDILNTYATWTLSNTKGELTIPEGSSTTFIPKEVGPVILTAQVSDLSATAQITVSEQPITLTELIITSDALRLGIGQELKLQVRGVDQHGNSIDIQPTWSVTNDLGVINPDTGTVATFTATNEGQEMILATDGGVVATILVTVEAPVVINNSDLETILQQTVGKTDEELLFPYELEKIVSLDLSEQEIKDLTGLQFCTNLASLDLSTNQINDLSPIANLFNLTSLDVSFNYDLQDVSYIQNLINLETFKAQLTDISDPTPLAGLTKLKVLNLQGRIETIDFLTQLTQIETLKLGGNLIQEIKPLENLTNLKLLYLDWNQITDISALNHLLNLEYLKLTHNPLSSNMIWTLDDSIKKGLQELRIGPIDLTDDELINISDFPNLKWLDISGLGTTAGITKLDPLIQLTQLQHLFASDNSIVNLTPLLEFQSLKTMDFENNQINDLTPLVEHEGVGVGTYLNIKNNQLDLTPGSTALDDINALKEKKVEVKY